MLQIPRLKNGITVHEFTVASNTAARRFVVQHGSDSFLVSAMGRALVLALVDADDSPAHLEHRFAHESGQHRSASQLVALAHKLLPARLFHGAADGATSTPFLIDMVVLDAATLDVATRRLAFLFDRRLALALLGVFAILHALVLPSAAQAIHSNWALSDSIGLFALVALSGLVHELGHVSACRRFGCPHGAIGCGLYVVFPAWYADVSMAWRLSSAQRAAVDLGGVYFQAISLIFVDAYALVTGGNFALNLVWTITFTMLFTLNPVFKFDGYWLLSDLSGLHNLHRQFRVGVGQILAAACLRGPTRLTRARCAMVLGYAALAAAYFFYFGQFLSREIAGMAARLPAELQETLRAFAAATDPWRSIESLAHFVVILAWPVTLGTAALVCVGRLWRFGRAFHAGERAPDALGHFEDDARRRS